MPLPAITDYDLALRQYRIHWLIEAAGLFWLFAELLILFAMTVACNHLRRGGRATFVWESRYTRRLTIWIALFAGLLVAVAGRHWFWPPVHVGLESLTDDEVVQRWLHREQVHLVIWGVFVAGWVALEAAIVGYGAKAYRLLRAILTDERGRSV